MPANNCPNCAPYDCYHICPNSPHFYSPEQERMDDATYGDDDNRERYAATLASMDHEADIADEENAREEADMFFEDREPGSVTEAEYQAKVEQFLSPAIGQWVHPVDAGVKADDFSDDLPF